MGETTKKKTAAKAGGVAALMATSFALGAHDFGPVDPAAKTVGGMRQILKGEEFCKPEVLGAIVGDMQGGAGDPAWCFQVNGAQIQSGSELCGVLERLAASVPVQQNVGSARVRVTRLIVQGVDDPAICAQVQKAGIVDGRFVAD